MNGNLGRERLWSDRIWSEIDNAVREEVGRIRVAQKVFPSSVVNNVLPVCATRAVPFGKYEPPPDGTGEPPVDPLPDEFQPFVEISSRFVLTQQQVEGEENVHLATSRARLAATAIAYAEDTILFWGQKEIPKGSVRIHYHRNNADYAGWTVFVWTGAKKQSRRWQDPGTPPPATDDFGVYWDIALADGATQLFFIVRNAAGDVKNCQTDMVLNVCRAEIWLLQDDCRIYTARPRTDNVRQGYDTDKLKGVKLTNQASIPHGFVAEAGNYDAIAVDSAVAGGDLGNILAAVAKGIAALYKRLQPGPYALFLPPFRYGQTFQPPAEQLKSPGDQIIHVTTAGCYMVNSLEPDIGLLVSVGGEPANIILGTDAMTAFTNINEQGNYHFRVFERIQMVVRDGRAFQTLNFFS
jgi:uncharacterized linocin/CFP29 family protein